MNHYDYLIVGAGLYGAVFAQQAKKAGKTCLVIDKRSHIAGNIYTEEVEGIQVHRYGAHIFHTSSKAVWQYVNQFAEFNRYTNSPVAVIIIHSQRPLLRLRRAPSPLERFPGIKLLLYSFDYKKGRAACSLVLSFLVDVFPHPVVELALQHGIVDVAPYHHLVLFPCFRVFRREVAHYVLEKFARTLQIHLCKV